jgi:DNA modification methylase
MAKVKETKIDAFKPQGRNANRHSQRGLGSLEASMRKHGYVAPMTAAADGEIIDGSARLDTVANVFDDDVLVVEHDGTKPIVMVRTDIPSADSPEAREISIAANRIAELNLTWDAEVLLEDLQSGVDLKGLFDQEELDALLDGLIEKEPMQPAEAQTDKAAELQKLWGTSLGQIWQLGKHRLACGDCTDKATVERLMQGERAQAVVTDPPYGVGVEYSDFDDTLENVKRLIDGFMPIALGMSAPIALTPGIPAMWHYPKPDWLMAWIHPAATSSGPWGFIGMNPILIYGHDPYLKAGKGRHHGHIVMAGDREGADEHPVTKPLNVWLWLVERMTVNAGDIVYEPFGGSGTTIIACEQLNRQCRAVEISPAYCAVILQRYKDSTNVEPVLIDSFTVDKQ